MRTFFVVWFGQMISITGSGLTYFALGVRVFQDTGSVTQYAFILVFTVLPRLFIGPIGGVLTDRWNRRHVMIISDVGAGLATVAILVLSATNNLQIWHIYVATAVNSAFAAFQLPAYLAASTQLVPKDRIEQAAGMVQLGEATTIIAPLFAGFLLPVVGLNGILAIDFGTFLFALITLLLVRFPNVAATAAGSAARSGIVGEIIHAWRHLAAKPGLMALLGFFAVSNFLVGSVEVLVTPLILILADERTLGVILFAGGIGVLVGSIVMSVWAGPSRRMYTIFGAMFLSGFWIAVAGSTTWLPLLIISAFLIFLCQPAIRATSQVIFQKKIELDLQGRVFSLRDVVAQASFPVAQLLAGPLTDDFFEPLMAADGRLAGTVGRIIGVGPGRGIGLGFIVMGALTMIVTLIALNYAPLRLVEDRIPDVVSAESPARGPAVSTPETSQVVGS
ncbi:MAG: MFS transporter [Ardenticatenales bacterium]|nr:MFS transporter [Ardenticatenales bacterium]